MARQRKDKPRFAGRIEHLEDRRVMSVDPVVDLFPPVDHFTADEPPSIEHMTTADDLPAFHHEAPEVPPQVDQHVLGAPDFWIDSSDQSDLDDYFEQVDQMLASAHNLTGWYNVQQNYGFTGLGQTVAVIDSGIAYDHFALGGGFGAGRRVVGGWDFTEENDGNPYDDGNSGSHGTHVSGIIGSSSSTHTGVAPGVDFVGLRVFNDAGQGFFSWIENALRWIHDNRNSFANPITAVNLSLGVASWNDVTIPSWANLEEEFAQLKADGIFIAVSAGNSFSSYNTPGLSYPAASPNVVPVMSTNDAGAMSGFSQRLSRAIAAPGESIVSTVPDYAGNSNGVTDDFASKGGTSMAAPYVAGASVLIRQAMQFVGMTNITQDTIYNHMMATADTFFDAATNQSYKRLNLGRAIDALMPNDDFGSTSASAYDLGSLASVVSMNGRIGTLTDVDCFCFTASSSGMVTFNAAGSTSMSPAWQVWGATALSTQSGEGAVSFNVTAGQTYTVGLSSTSGMGDYSFSTEFEQSFTFTDWGSVGFNLVSDVSVADERWFRVETSRDGFLSILGAFNAGAGSVNVALYNANLQLVAAGATSSGVTRVDAAATAGTEFYLRVVGSNSDIDFKLVNLVSQSGTTVTALGTAGADAFSFTAGATHTLSINGVDYSFAAGAATQFNIDGLGGADALVINGSAAVEAMTLSPTGASVASAAYGFAAASTEYVTAYSGGGADQLFMYDSAANDIYDVWTDRARMAGSGYLTWAYGFTQTCAYASGGTDRANFYDTAGYDVFETRAGRAILRGTGYFNDSHGFERTCAYSTTGDDKALMYDSAGDETYVGYWDRAIIQGSTFYHEARGFHRASAFASQGNDRAGFYDTAGDEVYAAFSTHAVMEGVGFYNEARGFDKTTGYATGGNDRAAFYDSAGADTYAGYADKVIMYGAGFYNEARNFDKTTTYATAGNDRAVFYDSAGDDVFAAWSDKAVMYGTGYYNDTRGFKRVNAGATTGNDRAVLYDSAGNDTVAALVWGAYMSGGAYYNEVRGFDRVTANKQLGGNDTAIVEATDYLFTKIGAWL